MNFDTPLSFFLLMYLNSQLLVNINAIKKLIPSKPRQLSVKLTRLTPQYHIKIKLNPERF